MTVTINGTTGITSPEVALDNGTADGGQVVLKSSGYSNWNIDNYSGSLRNYYGSTVYTTLDSSGNFGIGTNSPAVTSLTGPSLNVKGSSGASGYITSTSNDLGSSVGLYSGNSSADNPSIIYQKDLRFGSATNIGIAGYTERMRIDSSGNVLVGTTTATQKMTVAGSIGSTGQFVPYNGSTVLGYIGNDNSITGGTGTNLGIRSETAINFATGGSTERMRIDSSGNLLVGTTSLSVGAGNTNTGFNVESAGTMLVSRSDATAAYFNTNGDRTLISMRRSGNQVGSISVNSSATAYNTSSDYRLKENITPMTGALSKVAQLKPVTYTWKADGSVGQGFIAHEIQAVVPDCVTGEKDAVDADGNPVYQGIDTSFLVATLTAAIQEQQAIITDLKARIEVLENK